MTEKPGDFDWVTERQKCSIFSVFKELERQAKANTEKREASLTEKERQMVSFRFETQSGGSYFAVLADNVERIVRFSYQGDRITVKGDTPDLTITLTLNDDGDCRLKVNGDGEFQPWQVLRMSLEGLFFDLKR